MAVSIAHLTDDQPALITISPNASLQEAVELMITHDFSQLPVVEDGRPYGNPATFVTSSSIARALRSLGTPLKDLRVKHATVMARTVSIDEDLFSKMDDLLDAYAVLVLHPDGSIAGIVTNYDTTQYFRRRAEDMLLVEDIETTLKDHVRSAFGGDENNPEGSLQMAINALSSFVDSIRDDCAKAFRKFCATKSIPIDTPDIHDVVEKPFSGSRSDRKFDDLTLNEYIQLARSDEAWAILGPYFGVSDAAFLEMLEGVRKTRNKLMHFRPDISTVERDHLRFCAEWFKNHPPLMVEHDSVESDPLSFEGRVEDSPDASEQEPTDDRFNDDDEEIESEPVESKYAPLAKFLLKIPSRQERLIIHFSEIENIIRDRLPAAAREHRSWWANDSTTHVQSRQWLKVNWRVVSINMAEEKVTFARARDREQSYIKFFSAVQNKLRAHSDFPLHSANPTGANWLVLAYLGEGKASLNLSFGHQQRFRLEFYIDTGDRDENNRIFGNLSRHRAEIESSMVQPLEWEPLEKRRASRIALYTEGSFSDEPEKLDALVDWAVENALRLHRALEAVLHRAL